MKNWKKLSKVFPAKIALFFLAFYRCTVSPDHGAGVIPYGTSRCRFYPSCSAYAAHAIRQYGLLKGSVLSFKRIIRCNPWSAGGYDPIR